MDRDEVIREMNDAWLEQRAKPYVDSTGECLKAALARAEELGFKLLPREPGRAMRKAGADDYAVSDREENARLKYQAMWDVGEKK